MLFPISGEGKRGDEYANHRVWGKMNIWLANFFPSRKWCISTIVYFIVILKLCAFRKILEFGASLSFEP